MLRLSLALVALALIAPGCAPTPTLPLDDASSDVSLDTRPQVCTPGAQVACACVGGTAGAQVCASDGTSLGACACPDGGVALDVADAGVDVLVPVDAPTDSADATETGIEGGVDGGVAMDAPDGSDVLTPPDVSIDLPADTLAPADVADVPTDACVTDANLSLDPLNCGACGRVCTAPTNATPRCALGACAWSCSSAFGDCNADASDGCETSLRSDANCGMCGRRCTALNGVSMCTGSTCALASCTSGYSNCDGNADNGCETDLRNDPANCGTCGARCTLANATPACVARACSINACNAGFANCDGNAANGCEHLGPCL